MLAQVKTVFFWKNVFNFNQRLLGLFFAFLFYILFAANKIITDSGCDIFELVLV